jgi:hypothetical protein
VLAPLAVLVGQVLVRDGLDDPAQRTVRAGFLGRDKLGSAITRADIATSCSTTSAGPASSAPRLPSAN